ncbi:family 27 glycoside hydrolase [Xylogone sp. PMI_703]|nr:family 27 glycoside hydrolase [Xylogone sp. PMI_703]
MISSSALLLALAAAVISPAAAQTQCGGDTYTPGTRNFTRACYDAIQNCAAQFEANATQVDCNDGAGNLFMQQEANLGATGSSQNNDAVIAFQDIRDLCVLGGHTSGTWGFSDNQWYWIAAGDACYTTDSSRTDVVPTRDPPYCIQNRDSSLPECYPQPESTGGGKLKVLKIGKTNGGFTSSAKGWNTYGVQALQNGSQVVPSFHGQSGLYYTEEFVKTQCGVLANPAFKLAGYDYCSLDSGWQSLTDVDDHGRIIYNTTRFNLPELASWLHKRGLKLGVYVIPGVPCSAQNKTIKGTNIKVGDVLLDNDEIFCDFDFTKDGVQQWHDSVVQQWADWGVDMIKLDYLTPGSPQNGANLACNSSPAAQMYRNAIKKTGKQMRLNFSWKLCRNDTWLPFWNGLGESMRTDQDLDNYGTNTLMAWSVGQRAIDNYRQYIGLQAQRNAPITTHPDMDNLFIANAPGLAGVNDVKRYTVMNHWLGASANLIIGGDLTTVDSLGYHLTTSLQSIAAAKFFAEYPMQPRNPGTGDNLAKQLQAWIAGPSGLEAYVLVVNYGPDEGSGGFGTTLPGVQKLSVSLKDLGIDGHSWLFTDVWQGNSTLVKSTYTTYLDEGASHLLHLTKIL